jgi:hypothetical protein
VPLPVYSATAPPTDWGDFVQVHNDRDTIQASADKLPVINILVL